MADDNVVETKLRKETEEVKFTPAEMEKLAELQSSYQQSTANIGSLNVQKILLEQQVAALDNNIEQAKQAYTKIQAEERELVQKLNEKYGPGQLDPETGVFTPNK